MPSQFVKEGIQLAIANNPTLAYKESADEIIEKREFQLDSDFSNEEFTIDKVEDKKPKEKLSALNTIKHSLIESERSLVNLEREKPQYKNLKYKKILKMRPQNN